MTRVYERKSHCKRGHLRVPENLYKSGQCKLCQKETRIAWYQANKEEQNARTRKWWEENRERHKELTARWYQENRENHLESSRRWASDHLDLKAHYRRSRRSKISKAADCSSIEQMAARMSYHGYQCRYCGGPFEEVDHMIPISRGGSNWPSNLVPSCLSCNRQKFQKTYFEYVAP